MDADFCIVTDPETGHKCGKKVLAKGMCKAHYYRQKKAEKGMRTAPVNAPIRAPFDDLVQLSPERLERRVAQEIETAAVEAGLSLYEFRRRHWNEWFDVRTGKRPAAVAVGGSAAPLQNCVNLAAKWATRVPPEMRAELMADFLSLAGDGPPAPVTAPSSTSGKVVSLTKSAK